MKMGQEKLVSILSTRVSNSDKDDWKKLKRGLIWVKNTIIDKRVIWARSLSELFLWINADYSVHENMRSHTGGSMSMVYDIIHGKAPKQKINVNISTEA